MFRYLFKHFWNHIQKALAPHVMHVVAYILFFHCVYSSNLFICPQKSHCCFGVLRHCVHLVCASNVAFCLSSFSCSSLVLRMLKQTVCGKSSICFSSAHSLHLKRSGRFPEQASHTKLARFFASQIRSLLGVLQVPHGGW